MYNGTDIYILFIERSLSVLPDSGSLGFICSDRWMKNRYGGPLRSLVAEQFHLIPDIKGEAHVVFEGGDLYSHHNLYYVTSDNWNLRALQAVLLSAVSGLFMTIYSMKMQSRIPAPPSAIPAPHSHTVLGGCT